LKILYEGAHELQGFGLGRAGAKKRDWAGAKNIGWAELGQETEAALDRGQGLRWTEGRGWAGQRPEAGLGRGCAGQRPEAALGRGQRLGWTEARGWAGQRPEVGLGRG
jgi:hypothetical protein